MDNELGISVCCAQSVLDAAEEAVVSIHVPGEAQPGVEVQFLGGLRISIHVPGEARQWSDPDGGGVRISIHVPA